MSSIQVPLNQTNKPFFRFKSLILIIGLFLSIYTSFAQQFYFESKPFNPLIDKTVQRLGLSFNLETASKINLHATYTITPHISVFIGGNIQEGSRNWESTNVGIGKSVKYHVELSNGGNYGGLGFSFPTEIFGYNVKSDIQVGIEHFKIDNSNYAKYTDNRLYENTITSYNNIFVQASFTSYKERRFSLIANSRFSYLCYGNFKYYELTNNQIDNKSLLEEKNLKAFWLELGPSMNYHFAFCNLFSQLSCSFPLKDIEYAGKGFSSFDLNFNVGIQFLLDFKKEKQAQAAN